MKTAWPTADSLQPDISGLTLRTYTRGDAGAISDLYNRGAEHDGVPWRTDPVEMENWLSQSNDKYQPDRDQFLVELEGSLIAAGDVSWVDTRDDLREYRVFGLVDPGWRGRGVGRWLEQVLEGHARDLAARYPSEQPTVFGTWVGDMESNRIALIRHVGFEPVRSFYEMVVPALDEIEEPVMPAGLELRPVGDDQMRQLWDADIEAFRDHWGGFDESEESFLRWRNDPKFDPSLFVIAWDGDEIAGGVINEINANENRAHNRKRGWLRSVFVRRPWRRRGLGKAVVLRSLQVLRDRGMEGAGLGVDADNPNGAVALYRQCGFDVELSSTAYRKPMQS